ncbi:MAG TPA: FprA family A-type flavoprotein [Longilinea sp.]|nr:FprA family A-type flavoprotein [Longilinea sp.]
MNVFSLTDRVQLMLAADWNRRLFDALVPLPHGTSYNAYVVHGSHKTALLDTSDPRTLGDFMELLGTIPSVDYIIAHHAEQDHSGGLPRVLAKYPRAKVVASVKCKEMLLSLLDLPEERIMTVADGETLSLGDRTLEFIYTPWVHWPETMSTYLREEQILFSCDFFGSHLATNEPFAHDEALVMTEAKRYYAEIMMPFRVPIQKNLEKLAPYPIKMVAPSHGPVFDHPALIMDAYREWVSAPPKNEVVIPYISMHESTELMIARLVDALTKRGVPVKIFDLTVSDTGELAMALVDAATIVVGTPILLGGAHPLVAYACLLASVLKPKTQFAAIVSSYGWGAGAVERLPELISGLKLEMLPGVTCHGLPREKDLQAIDALAETIAAKHSANGLK